MTQGRNPLASCALVACIAGAAWIGSIAEAPVAHAAAKAGAKSSAAKSKGPTSRQFTGYVTAVDKTSITVEKRGKQPRTVVFSKHAEMKTTGDVEKDARVTVYYRDEDGQPTAHRVIVKPLAGGGTGRRGGSGSGGASGGGR